MKVTKAQLIQIIKEELIREQDDEQLYDLLKGERPPPRSTGQYSLRDPEPGTERRAPRRIIDQVSGLVGEMVTSGMTKEQIMSMVESHVDFLVQ